VGGGALDWFNKNANPMYPVVTAYGHEAEAVQQGCPSSTVFAYGLKGVALMVVAGFDLDTGGEGRAISRELKESEQFVNLASETRTTHILVGDKRGGGHQWPGLPGKSPFPANWSAGKIMHEISDIATDPSAWERAEVEGGYTVLHGTRDGVVIRVVVDDGGEIVTGYPINIPRNPK
jgi:hypothetical protein